MEPAAAASPAPADTVWAPYRLGAPAAAADTVAPVSDEVREAVRGLTARAGHPHAEALARRLGRAVPVFAAHQPCLFGGPAYVIVKALAAWAESERLRRAGVDAVPIFWIGGDDHDRREVAGLDVWHGGEVAPRHHDASADFAALVPVGPARPGPACRAVLDALHASFPGARAEALLAALGAAYFEGATMTEAFAAWLAHVLGERAPLFVDSAAPAVRREVAAVVSEVARDPERVLRAGRARAAAIAAAGLPVPVAVDDTALPFFVADAEGRRRRALHLGGGRLGLRGDGSTFGAEALAAVDPARLSPNVLLRPLVQARLFGGGVSQLGPSEHAYHAQSAAWHAHLVGPDRPGAVLRRRPNVTVVSARDAERLAAGGVDLRLAAAGRSGGREAAEAEAAATSAERDARARLDEALSAYVAASTAGVAGLEPAAEKFRARVERAIDGLQASRDHAREAAQAAQAEARSAALARLRPGGRPQDRAVGGLSWLLRFGVGAVDAVAERLLAEPDEGTHHVVVLR